MGAAKAAPGISFGVIRPNIQGRQVIQVKESLDNADLSRSEAKVQHHAGSGP